MIRVEVLCIGHACWDLNFHIQKHPGPDEKTKAHALTSEGGGPAANAAFSIARLGGTVAFAGQLGLDEFGNAHLNELREEGVFTNCIQSEGVPTPVASVWVSENGSRSVVNYSAPTEKAEFDFDSIQPACLLIDGHEWYASKKALKQFSNVPSVLDAGSWRDSTRDLAGKVSYLIASSAYARACVDSDDPKAWLSQLAKQAPFVAITHGERGVLWKDEEGNKGSIPAKKVQAVDTTGAGDLFHGAFALALARGHSFHKCLSWANDVVALSVRKSGGRTSFPFQKDVALLKSLKGNS